MYCLRGLRILEKGLDGDAFLPELRYKYSHLFIDRIALSLEAFVPEFTRFGI